MTAKIKAVEVAVTLAGFSRRADKSMTIRLATDTEAPHELAAWLDEHFQEHLTALLAIDGKATALSVTGDKDEKGQTPSQRLRNVIFGYWNALRERDPTIEEFEIFYPREMDSIIADYTDK